MQMTKHRETIIYFYISRRSFVIKDIELLRTKFDVLEFQFDTRKKWQILYLFIKQFIYLLAQLRRCDLFICFFAGYHSLLPALLGRIFRKPVIIFLGGADAYRYPPFNYGHFNKIILGKFTCYSLKLVSLLVPVDKCLIYSESDYYDVKFRKQGIKHFCQDLSTPIESIRLEYDHSIFRKIAQVTPPNSFITVAFGIEGSSFVRKGIDIIVEVAKFLPQCQFSVVGCEARAIKVSFTNNVKFYPSVSYDRLPELYSKHQFYLQLSIAEGFPSAICEAMLCECVPIGSKVAAIPDIIGDTGFLLDHRDVSKLRDLLERAITTADLALLGKKARARIIENFHLGTRKQRLLEVVAKYLTNQPI
jgi:glycosyltransferase involved in cell wall biosynthesis